MHYKLLWIKASGKCIIVGVITTLLIYSYYSVSVVGVILESSIHPVSEGDNLTLRCLDQHSTPPNLRADFYKDGSLIQNQTIEMIISDVSKSHEGFYSCKQPEREESPKSWISVTASETRNYKHY